MPLLPGKTTPDPELKFGDGGADIIGPPPKISPPRVTAAPAPAPSYSTPQYSQPPAPAAPAPVAAPAAPSAAEQAQTDTTQQMLEAALRAIEAEYGMTAEQLLTSESDVGRQYRLLMAESQRQGMQAQQAVQAGALDRGIVQSGIYADDTARTQAQYAEQQAAYEAHRQNQLAMLASQQASLPAQEAAARAAAAQQAAQAGLDLDVIKAAGGI